MKNISQIGNLPQIGVNIKNIWNHHLVKVTFLELGDDFFELYNGGWDRFSNPHMCRKIITLESSSRRKKKDSPPSWDDEQIPDT